MDDGEIDHLSKEGLSSSDISDCDENASDHDVYNFHESAGDQDVDQNAGGQEASCGSDKNACSTIFIFRNKNENWSATPHASSIG